MKKFSTILALLLSVCLICSGAMAEELINKEGTYPIVNEPYDVSIGFVAQGDGVDLEQYYFTAYMDYLTGLNIEWTCIDSSARGERLPLMLSTGDLPDAMIASGLSNEQLMRYGMTEEILRPVNDLLQYMPNFNVILDAHPEIIADITCLDGNIYTIPALNGNDNTLGIRFFYNQYWLDNLGLPVPTTLDEFYTTLVAFKEQDADGNGDATNEIPFSGSWDEGYAERAPIMTAMGFNSNGDFMGLNFLTDHPTAAFFPYTEQFRDYIEFMKKLFDEGLMDPDTFTQSEVQYNAKTREGSVGFGGAAANYIINDDPDMYHGYIPMSSGVCDMPLYTKAASTISSNSMIINADVSDEKAVVLAKFGDAFFDCRTSIETVNGVDLGSELDFFGWGLTLDEETWTNSYSNKPEDVDDWTFICRYLAPYEQPGYRTSTGNFIPYVETYTDTVLGRCYAAVGYKYEDWNLEFQGKCLSAVNYVLPSMYMEAEDVERLAELKTPLYDYAEKMEAQFITGAASLDDYDAFVAELENLGVQEYVDIYAKYWEPYYALLVG